MKAGYLFLTASSFILSLGASCTENEKISLASPRVETYTEDSVKRMASTSPEEVENIDDHISLDTVKRKEYSALKDIRLNGEVKALRNSKIAFRVGGFLSEVLVKEGDKVKKGQVLAKLDDRDYNLQLALAKAKRKQAMIERNSSEKEFQREKQLKKENVSTDTLFDKVKALYDQASVNLELADIQLAIAKTAKEDTLLKAPYDCVVARTFKDEGENVPSGNEVFEVYDTAEPEIHLSAHENLLGKVSVGDSLEVKIPSMGIQGYVRVERIVPVISESTRTFEIIAKMVDSTVKILPGSFVEASLK